MRFTSTQARGALLLLISSSSIPSTYALPDFQEQSTSSTQQVREQCASVHIIAARASGEPPGYGIIGTLAKSVQKLLLLQTPISTASNQFQHLNSKGKLTVTTEALKYPATITDYGNSIGKGTREMQNRIKIYSRNCPSSKIVLMGYSQGAAVIGDALCGGGGGPDKWPVIAALRDDVAPISSDGTTTVGGSVTSKVAAVVQMGDPRFVPGLPFDTGTSTTKGLYARDPSADCTPFADKMRSWCDKDDMRCASGRSLVVHLTYLNRYTKEAEKFIFEKLGLPFN